MLQASSSEGLTLSPSFEPYGYNCADSVTGKHKNSEHRGEGLQQRWKFSQQDLLLVHIHVYREYWTRLRKFALTIFSNLPDSHYYLRVQGDGAGIMNDLTILIA